MVYCVQLIEGQRFFFSKTIVFLSLKIDFALVNSTDPDEMPNSADPDEMPHFVAFHLGLDCLQKCSVAFHLGLHCLQNTH